MTRRPAWLSVRAVLVGSFLVLLTVSGCLLSSLTQLELEHRVNAPGTDLYELMTSYEGIKRWWEQANEAMGEEFEIHHLDGPTAGVGMHIGFALPGGEFFEYWTFTQAEPPSKIRMDVDFLVGVVFDRALVLSPQGAGTLIRWTETGRVETRAMRTLLEEMKTSAIANRRMVLDSAGVVAADQ